ncbi:MAG: hypothetical protein M3477_08265, partial [Gemmatimonadota bacterium]|nr:hypothetical protein [Gemmatimonadota bacterium]
VRARGRAARLVTVLEPSEGTRSLRSHTVNGDVIEVETAQGTDRHVANAEGWDVSSGTTSARLRGVRRSPSASRPLIDLERAARAHAAAPRLDDPPPLDGTFDGFDGSEPLTLDHEDRYRRSEEPYGGPEEFSAVVMVNWDEAALYLGVDVVKSSVVLRASGAPPLRLDNEPDDVHADGIQVYLRPSHEGPVYGFLIVPSDESGGIRIRGLAGSSGTPGMVRGLWRRRDAGYTITVAITLPEWGPRSGDQLGFDLLVNRAEPDRLRRAGQLVWSGGGGWVYLRGDRQDPAAFGVLELG